MQVWNVVHAVAANRHKNGQKFAIWAPSHNFVGSLQLKHVSTIGKNCKTAIFIPTQHVLTTYGELRPINGWGRFGSLGHSCKFQRVSRLGSVTARLSSGRQPNFAALNRRRHLYLARRPSRWALAHILVAAIFQSLCIWIIQKTLKFAF